MRVNPLPPETLSPELKLVHEQIASLVGGSQAQVVMLDDDGALIGPFPPMLHFPQFGLPALTFLHSLDTQATLDKKLREVAILTVGGLFGARFELYAHQIMAEVVGLEPDVISSLSAGGRPLGLTPQETIAHDMATALVLGRIVQDSTYQQALQLLGREGAAELIFLISG